MSVSELSTAPGQVPFVDLRPAHADLKERLIVAIEALMEEGSFIDGPSVAAFESAFAEYCGASHCVGMANGTDALRLALLATGIRRGDHVIVPAMTFVATFEAVVQAGGVPVVVDVSEADYGLDTEQAAAAVTRRTTFLLPVHLYGQMANMRAILQLATHARLTVIEDACQAHGATRDGLRAGAAGAAAAFSFYPSKNLGAMGDAGALVTSRSSVADTARALAHHGQIQSDEHPLVGYTARLDTIQSLLLLEKLPQLARWNSERAEAARLYTEMLAGIGDLVLPPVAVGSEPAWHLYVIRTARSYELAEFLRARGIGTKRHYPICPHEAPAFRSSKTGRRRFPVATALARASLSLPLFAGIAEAQVEAVVEAVTEFFEHGYKS